VLADKRTSVGNRLVQVPVDGLSQPGAERVVILHDPIDAPGNLAGPLGCFSCVIERALELDAVSLSVACVFLGQRTKNGIERTCDGRYRRAGVVGECQKGPPWYVIARPPLEQSDLRCHRSELIGGTWGGRRNSPGRVEDVVEQMAELRLTKDAGGVEFQQWDLLSARLLRCTDGTLTRLHMNVDLGRLRSLAALGAREPGLPAGVAAVACREAERQRHLRHGTS